MERGIAGAKKNFKRKVDPLPQDQTYDIARLGQSHELFPYTLRSPTVKTFYQAMSEAFNDHLSVLSVCLVLLGYDGWTGNFPSISYIWNPYKGGIPIVDVRVVSDSKMQTPMSLHHNMATVEGGSALDHIKSIAEWVLSTLV